MCLACWKNGRRLAWQPPSKGGSGREGSRADAGAGGRTGAGPGEGVDGRTGGQRLDQVGH